jgi:hypothetical protein
VHVWYRQCSALSGEASRKNLSETQFQYMFGDESFDHVFFKASLQATPEISKSRIILRVSYVMGDPQVTMVVSVLSHGHS